MARKKSKKKATGKRKTQKKKSPGMEFDLSRIFDNLSTYDIIVIGIVLLSLIIRIFFYPHCFWIDESREMAIARNFMRGEGYTLFGEYYVQHPYVFYTLVGISSIFFGMVDLAGIAVSIAAGTLSVGFLYLLGKEVYGEKTGLIASALLAFHPLHIFYSVRVINDITVIFFIIMSMYFFVRFINREEWLSLYIAGGAAALAMLTKMIAIILPPLLLIYIIFKKRLTWVKEKRYWYAIGAFMLFFLIYAAINLVSIGELFPLDFYLERFAPGGVDPGAPTYYLENFIGFVRLPLALLFFWGIVCIFLRKFRSSRFLLLWIISFMILISAQSDKVDRYILPIIPQICIIAGLGLEKIMNDFDSKKYVSYGFVAIICIWAIQSFYVEASLLIPNLAPGFCGFKETGDWLRVNSLPDDPIMIGSDNQIAWYADRENLHYMQSSVEAFYEYVNSTPIRYIVVDKWERTQPPHAFHYTDQGVMFWYPNFLNDSRFPVVDVILLDEVPVSFIYGVVY